jgi:hypothetical protein
VFPKVGPTTDSSFYSPKSKKEPQKELDPLDIAIRDYAKNTLTLIKGPIPGPIIGKRPPSRLRKPIPEPVTLPNKNSDIKNNAKKTDSKPDGSQKVNNKTENKGILYQFFTYIFRSIGYFILRLLGGK